MACMLRGIFSPFVLSLTRTFIIDGVTRIGATLFQELPFLPASLRKVAFNHLLQLDLNFQVPPDSPDRWSDKGN